MAKSERDYSCASCIIPNCTKKRLGWDQTEYYAAPNGTDIQGKPVQVNNCTIRPQRVSISGNEVFDCNSFKPMDAA